MSCTAAKRYILQHQANQATSTSSVAPQSTCPKSKGNSIELSDRTECLQNHTVVDCSVLPKASPPLASSMVSTTSAEQSVSSRGSTSSSSLPPKKRFLSTKPKKRVRIVLTGLEDCKDKAEPQVLQRSPKKIKLSREDVPQVNLSVLAGQIQAEADHNLQAQSSKRAKARPKVSRVRQVDLNRNKLEGIKRKIDELITFTSGLEKDNQDLRKAISATARSNQLIQERQERRSHETPPMSPTPPDDVPAAQQQVQKIIGLIQTLRQQQLQQQQQEEQNRQSNERQAQAYMANLVRGLQATQDQRPVANSSTAILQALMEKAAQTNDRKTPAAQKTPLQHVANQQQQSVDSSNHISTLLRNALAQQKRPEPKVAQVAPPPQQQPQLVNAQAFYQMLRQMSRR